MKHPYEKFEETELWRGLARVLLELEENQDITFMTRAEYMIGYLCKQLTKAGFSPNLT